MALKRGETQQTFQQTVNPGCLQAGIWVQIRHTPRYQHERQKIAVCTEYKESIFD